MGKAVPIVIREAAAAKSSGFDRNQPGGAAGESEPAQEHAAEFDDAGSVLERDGAGGVPRVVDCVNGAHTVERHREHGAARADS